MASITKNTVLQIPILFIILFQMISSSQSRFVSYNVVNLGADPNGKTDSTPAFGTAWSKACASTEAVRIYVPTGTYLLGLTKFSGPCNNNAITIQIDGTLIAPENYNDLGQITSWIQIHLVDGLNIVGGTIDGKGKGLWDCKGTPGNKCPMGTTNLGVFHSKNINITKLTSRDSQMFHMQIYYSQNVSLVSLNIVAPDSSPNTDGIHIQGSSFVTIFNTKITTGDDCISIGPGSNNLWMEEIYCGPGHGISIGGLGREVDEEGVHTVTVTKASFVGTQNGVRIKTLGTLCRSITHDVTFEHATMINVQNPIIIDQNYCAGGHGCTGKPSFIQISNITYRDIKGSSATDIAVKFDCSPERPCRGVLLENINLSYGGRAAKTSCVNAFGTISGTVNPPSCLK